MMNQIKKDLKYYLKLNYPITLEQYTEYDDENYYAAEIPDLPGCGAQGKTIEEALKNLEDAKKAWIKASLKRGLEIPEPVTEDQFSGKFLLRIPPKLHRQLSLIAKRESLSLNQYVKDVLEKQVSLSQVATSIETLEKRIREIKEFLELSNQFRATPSQSKSPETQTTTTDTQILGTPEGAYA